MLTIVACVGIELFLLGIAAGAAGYAAVTYLRGGGGSRQHEVNHSLLTLVLLALASNGVLIAIHTPGVLPALSTSVLVGLGMLIVISLALAVELICTARWLDQLYQHLEEIVQARTAHLQSANEHLAAELVACKQSAIALTAEYAHLLEQAKEIAAAEERTRLARDLHDSVTQTLYSASLIAQVLPAVWQRSPSEGERNLVKLRQLVRGALAEMRTLLFELRPAALDAANLGVLLQQLGDVLTGHMRIPVTITIAGEAEPPVDVKIAVYRIAQEAFNNIARHAGATQVEVTLHLLPEGVSLGVRDNGRGFDPTRISGEHMGVRIMVERAVSVGAHCGITSKPGQGTTLSLHWSTSDHHSVEVNTLPSN
jgi:signal transduction histidine kinase